MSEEESENESGGRDQESSDSIQRFEVSISTDRDHFLRRSCSSCGRDFKTTIDEADLAWVLSDQIKRIGAEIGANPADEPDEKESELRCPYCHHSAKQSEMHTEETIDYFKQYVYRECVIPMLSNMFSGLEDSIGGRHGGGFVSLSMSFEHEPISLPPRPIHGPEPADMKIVRFLCCDKSIKVYEAWESVTACVYCNSPVKVI